jgi:hypothetical protein
MLSCFECAELLVAQVLQVYVRCAAVAPMATGSALRCEHVMVQRQQQSDSMQTSVWGNCYLKA